MAEISSELQKEKRSYERKINTVTNNVQLLIESPDMMKLKMIEKVINAKEFDQNVQLIKWKKEYEILSESIDKKTDIFKIDLIKKISLKHNLGFFRFESYEGWKPSHLSNTIEKWFTANNKMVNEYDLSTRIYVLSPLENFNVRSYFGVKLRFKKTETFVFYKENEDTFLLIDSWGRKNAIRDFIGFTYRNDFNHYIFWSFIKMPVYAFLWSWILTGESGFNAWPILIISFLSPLIPSMVAYSSDSELKMGENSPRMNVTYMWSKILNK